MSLTPVLVDTSALGKPATALIHAIRSMTGTLYEPTRIRRESAAKADAIRTIAQAHSDRADLALRTAERFAESELRRQRNIEAIAMEATQHARDGSAEDMSEDWLARFRDACQDVSEPQARAAWARILAGEFNKRGSFSFRTLRTFAELEQDDLRLFSLVCTGVWLLDGKPAPFCIRALNIQPSPREYMDLARSGLIESTREGIRKMVPPALNVQYFNRRFRLVARSRKAVTRGGQVQFEIGRCDLTQAGRELMPIASFEPCFDYMDKALDEMKAIGFHVQRIENSAPATE